MGLRHCELLILAPKDGVMAGSICGAPGETSARTLDNGGRLL
jgi:hypothetical protein